MPIFMYKCLDCENVMEKFIQNSDCEIEIICDKCNSKKCKKQFSFYGCRVSLDAKQTYNEKIKPDAKKIMDKMKKGGNKEFFDVYGEK